MKGKSTDSGILKTDNFSNEREEACKFHFGTVPYADIDFVHEDRKYEGKDLCIKRFEDTRKRRICETECKDYFISWHERVRAGEVLPVSLEQKIEGDITSPEAIAEKFGLEENLIINTIERARKVRDVLNSSEYGYEGDRYECCMNSIAEGLVQQDFIKDDFQVIPIKEEGSPILNLWLDSVLTVDGGRCKFEFRMNNVDIRRSKRKQIHLFDAGIMVKSPLKRDAELMTILSEDFYTVAEAYVLSVCGIVAAEPICKEFLKRIDSKSTPATSTDPS
jgi:hypothetical protein